MTSVKRYFTREWEVRSKINAALRFKHAFSVY